MLLFLFLGLLQDSSLDELLRDLSNEKASLREEATRRLSERWTAWSEADLKKIEQAAKAGDSETAARVQTVFAEIALRRRIPARIIEAAPNLLTVLRAGSADQTLDLIKGVEALLLREKVAERDLIPVYIELLDDARPTAQDSEEFPGREVFIELRTIAERNLSKLVSKPQLSGREAWRIWWKANRDQPPADWYLPDLAHVREDVRLEALRRLAAMKEPAHFPRIFGALRTLRSNRRISSAIDSLEDFPSEILLQELRPLLDDPHPYARLGAARLLFEILPDASVAAVLAALEEPDKMDLEDLDPQGFRSGSGTLDWLASIRHPKAFDFLCRATKSGNSGLKDQSMWHLSRIESPEALDALAGMLDDPETQNCSGQIHGAAIDHPRFGDVGGILLASRLKLNADFNWICSRRQRDVNLAIIRNAWRGKKGLPPLPVPSLDPAPVAREKVSPLLADLTEDDEGRRSKATEALLQLGAGAWKPLQQSIAEASGKSKERLEAAALTVANAVRSVVAKGDAEGLASRLRERLHAPLRIADLEAMGDGWFHDPGMAELELEIDRDREGRGISIVVSVRKEQKTTPLRSLGWSSRGRCGGGSAVDSVFRDVWRKDSLRPFEEAILLGASEYAYQWVKIEKRRD